MDYQKLIQYAERRDRVDSTKKTSSSGVNGSSSGPDPNAVAKFLAKKRADGLRQAEEARLKKERLLALRNQNSKSAKAAKMMASKTKDNDFSKIILSEKEIEGKNLIESQLRRKQLNDPLERMKERIEKEQELELANKGKRRRKAHVSSDVIASTADTINKNRERFKYDYKEVKKQK